ncbi:MAG: Calx-beta domain-containing protein [Pyrinomonadaceae bacterium]
MTLPNLVRRTLLCAAVVACLLWVPLSDPTSGTAQAQTFTISGHVSEPPSGTGVGIAGVTLVLTLNGNTQVMTTTGNDPSDVGAFAFNNIAAGSDFDVVPSKTGLIFNPTSQGGTNLNSSRELFFTASAAPNVSIQFQSATVSATESTPDLIVTVTRSGDTTGTSSVDYTTSDTAGTQNCNMVNGAASSRCDYEITLGTLVFAAGETSKTILIPLIDDVRSESSETFSLILTRPIGASLGAPSIATLTIIDNETVNGTTNPIDNAGFFVRQHYIDFLNREPDASGLQFWTNEITQCGADAGCTELKRINVSGAFFLSIEFQETGYLVYRIYKSGFGNLPGAPVPVTFTEFLRDTQQIGQGVVVGSGNWQQQLESNKQAFTLAFVQRAEFQAAYPNTMTATEFVTKLNTNAGGVLDAGEMATLVGILGSTPADVTKRAQVLRAVAEDQTLNNAEFNKAFVLMQYFGYLRRNPNDAPDSDFSGYNFWLGKLNQFGNFINAEMVKAFISSLEYRQRFAP